MLTASLLVLWSTAAGSATTYLWDVRATIGARLCAGVSIGMALLGFSGYFFCALAGQMTTMTLMLAAAVAGLPLFLLASRAIRARLIADLGRAIPRHIPSWRRISLIASVLILTYLLVHLFQGTVYTKDGNIFTDNNNNIGDLPFHFSVIHGFLYGGNFPPQDTEFAGARLTYPFLVDFVTAQYMEAGASVPDAFLLQNFVLAASTLGLLYRTTVIMTRSTFAAIFAPLLFLCSGGIGFIHLFRDPHVGTPFLDVLRNLPREYTVDGEEGLRWGNAVTTLLATQRGLLLAIPFALLVWVIWWWDREHRADGKSSRRLLAAGILTGAQPLIHGHTFLMLLMIAGIVALSELLPAWGRDRTAFRARLVAWTLYFGVALLLAVPQILLLSQGSAVNKTGFFGFEPGWVAAQPPGILPFWWINLGFFIPALAIALLARHHGRFLIGSRLLRFYLPFLSCFVLPNFIRLAPWDMDNMKIFLYWHLASSIVIAGLLGWLWNRRRPLAKFASLLLVVSLTLSGALDVARVIEGVQTQETFDISGIAFATAVRAATPQNAVILSYPLYNHPILYAGRHLVMGYEGHLWSHGIDASERKHDVQAIYSGAREMRALLSKYHIDYVVVGMPERGDPGSTQIRTQDSIWSSYPIAAAAGGYMLYDVRR